MDVPRLDLVAAPAGSRDLVLLAHGGQEHSVAAPHSWRAPLLRMWPFARAAAQAAPGATVGLLRYRYRGWNGDKADAAADVRTVLERVEHDRVLLIGHSMGGRAVLRLADHDKVDGVLALAPWIPESEPVVDAPGRYIVLAHGDKDRVTDPALTASYAAKVRAAGTAVASFYVTGDTHSMLHRHGDWDELVRRFTTQAFASSGPTLGDVLDTDASRPTDPLRRWTRQRGPARAILSIARARLSVPVTGQI